MTTYEDEKDRAALKNIIDERNKNVQLFWALATKFVG